MPIETNRRFSPDIKATFSSQDLLHNSQGEPINIDQLRAKYSSLSSIVSSLTQIFKNTKT